jgi:hypothetical protein
MWLSLHGLRINVVVFLMEAEKPDHHHAVLISHHGDEAIVIHLNVKDHPAGLEDTRLWMSLFYVLRVFHCALAAMAFVMASAKEADDLQEERSPASFSVAV